MGWLIINPNQGSAQSLDNITNTDWNTEYNYCGRYIDIFFPWFDSGNEINLLSDVTLSYKDASGAIQPLIYLNTNFNMALGDLKVINANNHEILLAFTIKNKDKRPSSRGNYRPYNQLKIK